jgi:hypothetical protein
MRDVILQEFVTLDGLAAGPNNSVDFVPASTTGDRTFGQEKLGLFEAIDTILLGRITYQMSGLSGGRVSATGSGRTFRRLT